MSEEEFFCELYADIFSACPSDRYTIVSEDDNSSEYSSNFNNMNDRPTKKDVVTDSDTESKNETHGAGECPGLYSPWVAKSRTWLSDFHFCYPNIIDLTHRNTFLG